MSADQAGSEADSSAAAAAPIKSKRFMKATLLSERCGEITMRRQPERGIDIATRSDEWKYFLRTAKNSKLHALGFGQWGNQAKNKSVVRQLSGPCRAAVTSPRSLRRFGGSHPDHLVSRLPCRDGGRCIDTLHDPCRPSVERLLPAVLIGRRDRSCLDTHDAARVGGVFMRGLRPCGQNGDP